MSAYDAVVLGAEPDGLAAAAVLARAGLSVALVDERPWVGGALVTEEFAPGFRSDVCLHDPGWIPPALVSELELERHGLRLSRPPATAAALGADGAPLVLWRDVERTATGLRARCPADAERWPAFCALMARFARVLEREYLAPPPRLGAEGARELLRLFRLGLRLRGLGRAEMAELLRVLPMPVAWLLEEWFRDEALRGLLAVAGVDGILQGPRSGGTAFLFLHHHVGAEPGVFRARVRVAGGVGAVAGALASAARAAGAEVRLGSGVARVLVRRSAVEGVALTDGTELRARRVLSAEDPRRTLLELVGPEHLDPELVGAVRHVRCRGGWAKVNLALAELPRFPALEDGAGGGQRGTAGGAGRGAAAGAGSGVAGNADAAHGPLGGVLCVAPAPDALERAYDDAKHGRASARPLLEATIPSLHEPSFAPPGRHVMSVRVQYTPVRPHDGVWDAARRETLGDGVVALLAEHAPGLPGAILHRQVLAPPDLEERFGLPEGSAAHGELALDQALFMRPVPACARYGTPVRGLFLCGPGCHPGRGVTGVAGRLAARAALREVEA